MTYAVKEIFYTLQGEGSNAGRPAVFCRFTGCNLWTGRERDRSRAICTFCDTDFVGTDGPGGGKFRTAADLADAIAAAWPPSHGKSRPLVVCTRGEPLLQIDAELVAAIHEVGIEIAVETNGTLEPPPCVSPKAGSATVLTRGNELKLVFPRVAAQRSVRAHGLRELLPPADGRPGRRGEHGAHGPVLPGSSPVAAEPADPQDRRDSLV